MIVGKKILIFGGTGSLGNAFVKRYLERNVIVNYSRSENLHWKMQLKYKSNNLKFIIGDIRDYGRVEEALIRENPHIVIIAAALKHIDRCEFAICECIATNFNGPNNVLNVTEKHKNILTNLETVCLVSTDKACQAISSYGAAKFLAERSIIEKSYYSNSVKYVCIRYGNVINSRGSILKILKKQGLDPNVKEFCLTHEKMTRFWMTLDTSLDLLEHAIVNGESGDVVVPKLISINIKDLFEIYSQKYGKPIIVTGLRSSEKLLESLISPTDSLSIIKNGDYYHIKPHYKKIVHNIEPTEYSSNLNPLSKTQLEDYLNYLNLL